MMELQRTELFNSLEQMAETGSLLVVGGPGSGKSWLLQQFAARHDKAGDDVLLLLAEEHNYVESLDQLGASLKTPAGIIPTLKAYKGSRKFLIIDSLDALRAEASQRVFRQLIRQVHRELPEWTVIASIRSFDAMESVEVQRLFVKKPDDTPSPGLIARHISVPVFSDLELDEAVQQDTRLAPILSSASLQLREILRNAFNLWLVIHLLDENFGIDWLPEIESEVQLFERYWHYRISARDDSYDRIRILTDVTTEMVNSRTLSVALQDSYKTTGASSTFKSLLSDEVLRKTQTERVAYSHNILFDFSVSKLLLDEHRLFAFLQDSRKSIFFRPSLSYFLALLWYKDRDSFWSVTSRFFAKHSELPARVTVIPGITIFRAAMAKDDFVPLWNLSGEVGLDAIVSLLRAIQAFAGMTSRRASLWLPLLCELSNRLDITFLNEYLALLEIASRNKGWSTDEQKQLASASIRLLNWMWKEAESDRSKDSTDQILDMAAGRVIPLVTSFYPVDPGGVRGVLSQVLQRIGKRTASPKETYWVANKLDIIIENDPEFAVEVYAAAFAYKEESREETNISRSKVLLLTSTRAQDYSMAYYILGVRFSYFLSRDLVRATLAAVRSVSAEVEREHASVARKIGKYSTTFEFAGIQSHLITDRSEIWDQGYRDNVSLQMFDALLNHLSDNLKSGALTREAVWTVFKLIAKESKFPVVWKRVMERSSHTPDMLPFVLPLLLSPQILMAPETSVVAGTLIARLFDSFDDTTKRNIEEAIWSTPNTEIAKIYRDPNGERDRLLACIPEQDLSQRAKAAIQSAKLKNNLRDNRPHFTVGSVATRPMGVEDWLRQRGVDTDTHANRDLLAAKEPLAAFETTYVNGVPALDEINGVLIPLEIAYAKLKDSKGADEQVIADVFTTVAGVARSILKNRALPSVSKAVALSRAITADAAIYPHPQVSEKADEHFDRPMWSPTPKIEAAQALIHCVDNWGLDPQLEGLIRTLSTDNSPAVRFQIAIGLGGVYNHDANLFWEIAKLMLSAEKATGVLVALVRTVGHPFIAKREPQKVVAFLKHLLRRKLPKQRPEDVFEVVVDSLTQLYVYLGEHSADTVLRSFEKSALRYAKQLQLMASSASAYLTYQIESSDASSSAIRSRAREVESRVIAAADHGFQVLEGRSKTTVRATPKVGESWKHLLMTLDTLVFKLKLLVNADPQLTSPDQKPTSDSAVGIFFKESGDLWNAVVSADSEYRHPIGPSTAQNLMESFNKLLSYDPAHVLKLTARLITGRTFGYQFDSFAIGEFVKFSEQFLADHKELLRESTNALYFAEILDVFVSAGWPDATQIVTRLDAAIR
jgi:KaiC/GvpD/RAD55 family RecA-like ATPase